MENEATKETAGKAPPTPEHKLRMRAGRLIGRGVWNTGFSAEHPDATKDEKQAAWNEASKDFLKIGMRPLRALEQNGLEVVEKSDS